MIENFSTLVALIVFAFVTTITPGPNNLMMMTASAGFGWRRTIPQLMGFAAGCAILIACVVLGLGSLFEANPYIGIGIKIAGAGWLFWLAWQFVRPSISEPNSTEDRYAGRPLSFFEAALFQWVNPKAWTVTVGASAAYADVSSDMFVRAFTMSLTLFLMAPLTLGSWALAGGTLNKLLSSGSKARAASFAMAALIAVSAVLVLFG